MTRKQKYKETAVFHFYNANPKNRIAADCVVRAICTALGQTWEQTVREMTEVGIELGRAFNEDDTIKKYLERKGWVKCYQPRKGDNTKYTGKEWCLRLQEREIPTCKRMERMIANIGGHHMVAIMDGKIQDIWDCSGKCIGNYWIEA